MKKQSNTVLWICRTAVFMAINIAVSCYGIPVPGGHFYLTDLVICTAALLFDPLAAFMVGGVGSMLGDLIFYPVAMFVSLVTHGLQAVVISTVSRHLLQKKTNLSRCIAVTLGGIIMVIGYTAGKAFVYSTPEYALIKLPYEILQATVGAVGSILLLRNKSFSTKMRL